MDDKGKTSAPIGLKSGSWILNQFRIVRQLARGGMGRIYLAAQPSMGRLAVVKVVWGDGSMWDAGLGERFRKEARVASRLVHPNIITVYNFGELPGGALFMAMEYVKGITLTKLMAEGLVPLDRAVVIARQCLAALAFAHENSVLHRDLKPDNVMLTTVAGHDHVKILDFGLARIAGEQSQTVVGTLLGTPTHMSPEQCRGEPATAASDQYAMGLILYQMLAGRPAVEASSMLGYLTQHQFHTPATPSQVTGAAWIEPFDSPVMRMIAKDPSDRFRSLVGAQQALEEAATVAGLATSWADRGSLPAPDPEPEIPEEASATVETVIDRPSTAVVRMVGERPMEDRGFAALERNGWRCVPVSGELVRSGDDGLWVLGVDGASWAASCRDWSQRGLPLDRTLVCIDGRVEGACKSASIDLENVVTGPHPVDSIVAHVALRWMSRGEAGGIQTLAVDEPLRQTRVVSSLEKARYVDAVIEDARAAGYRHRVLRALSEVAEEMVLNALFHARVDEMGRPLDGQRARSDSVVLGPGEEATLRWLLTEEYAAISIRDPFGSLRGEEVLARVAGRTREPSFGADGGAGMGLHVMARAAQHLIVGISPDRFTEVLAIVPTTRSANEGRSVTVLRSLGLETSRCGARLWLVWGKRRGAVHMQLRGEIDETSDLRGIYSTPGEVRLDLGQVTRINSMGIRNWLDALRDRDRELLLALDRCSMAVVSQINMIPTLTEGATLHSMQAPYYCPRCDQPSIELLRFEELSHAVPPPRSCSRCQTPLEFDDLPEEYFAFFLD